MRLFIFCPLLIFGCMARPANYDLVIANVNVISMANDQIQSNQNVYILGDSIVEISDAKSEGINDQKTINGTGKFLLPGLMDAHLHLSKKYELTLLLEHGVTSVRHMNGGQKFLQWSDSISNELMTGPRIFSSSPWIHRNPELEQYGFTIVQSEDQAREVVNRFHDEGYPFLKIAEMDTQPFLVLMDEAKKIGMPVTGHIPNYEKNLPAVFSAGMRSVEHLMEMFWVEFDTVYQEDKVPRFVEMIRQSGTAVAPMLIREDYANQVFEKGTKFLTKQKENMMNKYYTPDEIKNFTDLLSDIDSGKRTRRPEDIESLMKITKALNDGRVTLLLGTDSGGFGRFPGEMLHAEMELFSRAGISNYDILKCATVNPARVLDQKRLGRVEVGYQADLILVDENPLENLNTLKKPTRVIQSGKIRLINFPQNNF